MKAVFLPDLCLPYWDPQPSMWANLLNQIKVKCDSIVLAADLYGEYMSLLNQLKAAEVVKSLNHIFNTKDKYDMRSSMNAKTLHPDEESKLDENYRPLIKLAADLKGAILVTGHDQLRRKLEELNLPEKYGFKVIMISEALSFQASREAPRAPNKM